MSLHNTNFLEAFTTLFRRYLTEELNTNFPAEIVSYDYKTQMAEVQPLIKRHYADGTDVSYPIIPNVPVMMPRAGGAMLKLPVKPGDTVLVVCSKPSLENWLTTGGEASQNTTKQFQLVDAIAIVGLFPFSTPSLASEEEGLELIYGGMRIIIRDDGTIELGSDNVKKLIKKSMITVFNDHTHSFKDLTFTPNETANAGDYTITDPVPATYSDETLSIKDALEASEYSTSSLIAE